LFHFLVSAATLDAKRQIAYLKRHWKTLWACDFFSKRVWTLGGLVQFYALFFIHVPSRRIILSGITCQPDAAWMAQQARNLAIHLDVENQETKLLLRDGDFKFTPQFDAILQSEGMEVRKLPPYSPNLNAFAERWIQSIKRECLDHFTVFGESHLRYLIREYVQFYNTVRPHQGLDNNPIDSKIIPFPTERSPNPSNVRCKTRLGGILKHFYLQAA
jgi:putative transposase